MRRSQIRTVPEPAPRVVTQYPSSNEPVLYMAPDFQQLGLDRLLAMSDTITGLQGAFNAPDDGDYMRRGDAWTGPQGSIGPAGQSVAWLAGTNPRLATVFVADRALTITGVTGIVEIANVDAASVSVVKAASGVPLSAGTPVHSGSGFDAAGTPGAYQSLPLLTGAAIIMAVGDRLGLQTTGAFGPSVASITVQVA